MSVRRSGVPAVLAVLALLAGPALTGCGGSPAATGGKNFVEGDGGITVVPSAQRGAAVSLSGTTLEGRQVSVEAWRGKPVVLNVWGSWCAPCRKEAPELEAAHQRLRTAGVEFLGLNFAESNTAAALAFQRSFAITYPSLADDGGRSLLALRGAVTPKSIPSTVVLDAQGRIGARVSGTVTTTTLVDLVDEVRRSGG